jgi:hypothetical protein
MAATMNVGLHENRNENLHGGVENRGILWRFKKHQVRAPRSEMPDEGPAEPFMVVTMKGSW